MKKKIIATLLTTAAILSLAACGRTFTCDICGKEKSGKSYTESFLGAEVTYCKDCHDDLEKLGDALKDLFD